MMKQGSANYATSVRKVIVLYMAWFSVPVTLSQINSLSSKGTYCKVSNVVHSLCMIFKPREYISLKKYLSSLVRTT